MLTEEKQNKFYSKELGTRGNCMMACFANIMQYPIEQCPAIEELFACTKPHGFWLDCLVNWLSGQGYELMHSETDTEPRLQGLYYIVSGKSPRNAEIMHAVIYKAGKIVFDPHPDDQGIVEGSEKLYEWLVKI